MKMLSVVIPVYNEEKQMGKTISTICSVLDGITDQYQMIVVDDGSADGTWQVIKALADQTPQLEGIRFSRNFGKEAAIMAGLSRAEGDACIIMDADLQHPPALIPEMVRHWEEGTEVVEAVKEDRGRESPFTRLGASLFYKIMYRLSGFKLERASDFKLLDRKVVQSLLHMPERNILPGLSAWVGYSRTQVCFKVPEREPAKADGHV